jgi:hypothetical protein
MRARVPRDGCHREERHTAGHDNKGLLTHDARDIVLLSAARRMRWQTFSSEISTPPRYAG